MPQNERAKPREVITKAKQPSPEDQYTHQRSAAF